MTKPKIAPSCANIDIETSGLTWQDFILCVGVTLREHTGHTQKTSVVEKSKYECDSPLAKQIPVETFTEYLPEGWIHTSFVLNHRTVDMFNQEVHTIPEMRHALNLCVKGVDWVAGHVFSFDLGYLFGLGILDYDLLKDKIFDTRQIAKMTGGHDSHALDDLLKEYGIETAPGFEEMKGLRANLERLDPKRVLEYGRQDTEYAMKLFLELWPLAVEQYPDLKLVRDEGNFIRLLGGIREAGIKVDTPQIHKMIREKQEQVNQITKMLLTHKINGPDHKTGIIAFCKKHGQVLPLTDSGKNFATKKDTLFEFEGVQELFKFYDPLEEEDFDPKVREELEQNEFVYVLAKIVEGRGIVKQLSTWLKPFLEEMDGQDRVHGGYAATTFTYRLKCKDPAMQTVPAPLRLYACEAPYTVLKGADIVQAEIFYTAAFSKENVMAKILMSGADVHTETAVSMFKDYLTAKKYAKKALRRIAKAINFGIIYGIGIRGLVLRLKITEQKAQSFRGLWRQVYPTLFKATKKVEDVWLKRGYLILAGGKRIYLTNFAKERSYKAFNNLIQGSVAETVKTAMLRIEEELYPNVRIVGQTHDEIVYEAIDDSYDDRIIEIMVESAAQDILSLTDPPLVMKVDVDEYYRVPITEEVFYEITDPVRLSV